jgi:hypothetical protein
MLLGISDKETGKKYHICGGFPSASGKTNLAMTLAPDALGDRYHVEFYGDDIAWLWVDETAASSTASTRSSASSASPRTPTSTPTRPRSSRSSRAPGVDLHQRRLQREDPGGLVGGRAEPPADLDGWLDWKGELIADREPRDDDEPWAHPNSRFTTTLANVPNVAPDYDDAAGVPIDAIIFGGRTRDREPLIRAITDLAEGVYDGLTLGAEATFAAEGVEGVLRYDPMSMRPFMAYGEGDYAAHWLNVVGKAKEQPIFAHVNWFQRDPEDGHFLWPGYRENLRPLLWLMQLKQRRGHRCRDARRRHPDARRAPASRASTIRRPRTSTRSSPSTTSRWPGDGLPRGAPQAVRRSARGDLGGAPPGHETGEVLRHGLHERLLEDRGGQPGAGGVTGLPERHAGPGALRQPGVRRLEGNGTLLRTEHDVAGRVVVHDLEAQRHAPAQHMGLPLGCRAYVDRVGGDVRHGTPDQRRDADIHRGKRFCGAHATSPFAADSQIRVWPLDQ